jgi:hypothetical protein
MFENETYRPVRPKTPPVAVPWTVKFVTTVRSSVLVPLMDPNKPPTYELFGLRFVTLNPRPSRFPIKVVVKFVVEAEGESAEPIGLQLYPDRSMSEVRTKCLDVCPSQSRISSS